MVLTAPPVHVYLGVLKIITMKKIIIPACLLALGIVLFNACSKEGLNSRDSSAVNAASSKDQLSGDGLDANINKLVKNIHWIEQACFRIDAGKYTVYIDPNSVPDNIKADVILITHPHGDHWSQEELDKIVKPTTILIAPAEVVYNGKIGKRVVLKPGEEYNFSANIKVKAVPAYNIDKTWAHPKENNWVGYLLKVNGVTIYHAGDTELVPEMKTFTADIALLSLGQTYTFNSVDDAAQAAKDVQAKLAIPMHFGLYEGTAEDALTFKSILKGSIPVRILEKEK